MYNAYMSYIYTHTCHICTTVHVQRYMYTHTCIRIYITQSFVGHGNYDDPRLKRHTRAATSCDIFNLGFVIFPCPTHYRASSVRCHTCTRVHIIHVHAYMSYTYTHACTHVVYIHTLTHRTCTCHICTHVYRHLHIYMGKTCGFLRGAGTAASCSSRGKDDNLSRNKSQNEIKSTNNSPLDLSLRPHSQTSLIRKVWSET